MKVIVADHDRRYDLPGLPGSARRPVDVDASNTSFTSLRSFRVYRFQAGSVVDGHAEQDEVFVVVTAGSVEIKIGAEGCAEDAWTAHTLVAPTGNSTLPFVAYLPPQSMYVMTPQTTADVAYARATPIQRREAAVFSANATAESAGVTTLLRQHTHAERLRLTVTKLRADNDGMAIDLSDPADTTVDVLVHLQGSLSERVGTVRNQHGASLDVHSWQTLAFEPAERATLQTAPGVECLMLTVHAV